MLDNLELSAEELIQQGITQIANRPALAQLNQLLCRGINRLRAPMRVAIVGLIKAGKSTSMNALLGKEIVATGEQEVTFNVTWFQYSEQLGLEVEYKNGQRETFPFEMLDRFTRRSAENLDELLSIDMVYAKYPHDLLKQLNMIDTPGLASFYQQDSENSLRAMGIDNQEIKNRFDTLTQKQTASADAVLFLFQKGITEDELKIVELFSGPLGGQITPLTAIGVLTKIDIYWPSEPDPYEAAKRITNRLNKSTQVNRVLYSTQPLAGFMALGAQQITDIELDVLMRLAALPEENLQSMLRSAERFTTRDYPDTAIPQPNERVLVIKRLGPYGIHLACQLLRTGKLNKTELAKALIQASGLTELQNLIHNHFGKRAYLIKLDKLLREGLAIDRRLPGALTEEDQAIARGLSKAFEELSMELQQRIREISVLRDYYEGKLNIDEDEAQMLLQVTREKGRSPAQLLGIPEETDPTKLKQQARNCMSFWKDLGGDPGCDPVTADAAQFIYRCYERIAYHLDQVIRHLGAI